MQYSRKLIILFFMLVFIIQSTLGISNVQTSVDGNKVTFTYQGTPPFYINIRPDTNIGQPGGYLWTTTYQNVFSYDMGFAKNPSRNFYYGVKDTSWNNNSFEIDTNFVNMCEKLIYNGDPKEKLNFVFISDNFTTKQEFLDKVEDFLNLNTPGDKTSFLNYYPYDKFKKDYNIYTFYNSSIDWGCTSSVDMTQTSICRSEKYIIYELGKYCDMANESDYLIILSNKPYRSFASSYATIELPKVRRLALSVPTSSSKESTWFDIELDLQKKMFLHELGHSLGDLSDEYLDYSKEQFRPIAGTRAKNIDVEGCPKWCSGVINTSDFRYPLYLDYKRCISNLENTGENNQAFIDCLNSANSINGLNIGSNCISGTGCYWPANAVNGFRSVERSLMMSYFTSLHEPPDYLGTYNERLVIESINQKVKDRQVNFNGLHLNILNLTRIDKPETGLIRFNVNLNIKNQNDDSIPIWYNGINYLFNFGNPDYLDIYSEGYALRELSTNNLNVIFNFYLQTKSGQTEILPSDFKDVRFFMKHNQIELDETYRFYVYNMTFVKIS
jgi:hypothetical protein